MEREIKGHYLEYFDEEHAYLVNGVLVPSVTEMMQIRYGKKYMSVKPDVLKKAADHGTAVHKAIEDYCNGKDTDDLEELNNFKWLEKQYDFKAIDSEAPVILFRGEEPVAAGRLDLVLSMNGETIGADIKTTSSLDKEYLAYQLNLYRIAYRQCYECEWDKLYGIWLRGQTRKMVPIPINEELAWGLVNEYYTAMNKLIEFAKGE